MEYMIALKTLESSKDIEFNILINIDNAFKYTNRPLTSDKKVRVNLTIKVLPYIQVYGEA